MIVLFNIKDNEKFCLLKREQAWSWVSGELGRLWEKLGEGNDQNIMYKKAYFNDM